ncbi:MAG: hypothetical protein GTO63_14505 [Anaerolineae bacterium]|nr:hypothetical protein [Anaerolineae bacterium]NIN96062.1 hypothetical protein [Anaerolineae bacterium]NIQ79092.1 hypothetical protein [Anaerolineae bacterium]
MAEKEVASLWWIVWLRAIAPLILGIFLLGSPGMTTVVLVTFVGAFRLIDGIFSLVGMFIDRSAWGSKLALGILGILVGIYVLRHPIWASVLAGGGRLGDRLRPVQAAAEIDYGWVTL